MDSITLELAYIQALALDSSRPDTTATLLRALRRQLQRKLTPHPPGRPSPGPIPGCTPSLLAPSLADRGHCGPPRRAPQGAAIVGSGRAETDERDEPEQIAASSRLSLAAGWSTPWTTTHPPAAHAPLNAAEERANGASRRVRAAGGWSESTGCNGRSRAHEGPPASDMGRGVRPVVGIVDPPPSGGPACPPAVSEKHLLFLVHGIGRHDDFLEGLGLSWDGVPDGGTGGNKEFRELLEAQLKTRLRGLNAQIECHSVEWHSHLRGFHEAAAAAKAASAAVASGGREGDDVMPPPPAEAGAEGSLPSAPADAAAAASGGPGGASDGDDSDAEDEQLLHACMPQGVVDMRSFLRENVMDIIYYMSRSRCQKLINSVAAQLSAKYEAFMADHPGFRGGVSILAHSFGSVIIYELLALGGRAVRGIAYPTLPFSVDCFFSCGSPAAMFLVSRRRDQRKTGGDPVLRPRCAAFFNIWSRADPVSWKVEPLLPPPTHEGPLVATAGERSWVTAHTRVPRSRLLPPASKALPLTASRAEVLAWLCDNDRRTETDMQLAASRAWISENLAALSAHSAYWTSEDLALFVLSQLLAPFAADITAREKAAAATANLAVVEGTSPEGVPEGVPSEAPAPCAPPLTPIFLNPPPLFEPSFMPDVHMPLEALGCLTLRSSVTGTFSPVVALIQDRRLYVYADGQRAAILPVSKVDLRGATVSNPLTTAASRGTSAAGTLGQLPASARIVIQSRDGKAVEMAAADPAEAGLWVRAIVETIAKAARAAPVSWRASPLENPGMSSGGSVESMVVGDEAAAASRVSAANASSGSAMASGLLAPSWFLSRGAKSTADETRPIAGEGTHPRVALPIDAMGRVGGARHRPQPSSARRVRLRLIVVPCPSPEGKVTGLVHAMLAPTARPRDSVPPVAAVGASASQPRPRGPSSPTRYTRLQASTSEPEEQSAEGATEIRRPATPAEDETGGAGSLLAYFGATRVATMQRRDGIVGSARRGSSWKARWVALGQAEVLFYERPPELKPTVCVDLTQSQVEVRIDATLRQLAIAPGDGTLLTLRAPAEVVFGAWIRALTSTGIDVRWVFEEGRLGRVATGPVYVASRLATPPDSDGKFSAGR